MAHPATEAAPVPTSMAEKAAALEDFLFNEGDEPEEEEQDETEADEFDLDEEADENAEEEADEADEQEAPAIDPPVSLNAEEKAVFAQLPPEAQQAWAASETRRNGQVQEATTRAANAQREAEARAAAADADAKRQYAVQLDQFVAAFEPIAPDPALARQNPQAYIAQEAEYRAMKAQHDDLVQRVKVVQQEADTEAYQAFVQQRDRDLMSIPEIANPETRAEFLDRVMGVATELGYDPGELAQGMQLRDIQALSKVAELKAKADKYDQAMAKRMQKVRSAKNKNLRPNAAPHAQARGEGSDKAWQRVKQTVGNKTANADAFADYLTKSGHL
jgi:hypothetical protein